MVKNSWRLPAFGAVYMALGICFGKPGWLLVWLGASLCWVGLAYARRDARVFGKGDDGLLRWGTHPLTWPHLLGTHLAWRLFLWRARENPHDRVAPDVWIGRRVNAEGLPRGITLVVDLTSEFEEPPCVREGRTYICLPTLDGAAPDPAALKALVAEIADWPESVYIHCALGHGRSALVAAALLVRKGFCPDAEQAMAAIVRARPQAGLNADQRAALSGFCQG